MRRETLVVVDEDGMLVRANEELMGRVDEGMHVDEG
jgi:hypothetical protein